MNSSEKEPKSLKVGDTAPDFELSDATGQRVRLSALLRTRVVVLFFYPKDGTPVCRAEACSFRDAYQTFVEAGAEVVGISSDTIESHDRFSARHRLPFVLLSDEEGAVRRLYGVPTTLGIMPGRVTYVIDRAGILRHKFSGQFAAQKHVDEALRIVHSL